MRQKRPSRSARSTGFRPNITEFCFFGIGTAVASISMARRDSRGRQAMSMELSEEARSIAEQIERYLRLHPQAADSADGIHRWWLAPPFSEESPETVQAALDLLESRGVVNKTVLDGGRVIYVASRGRGGTTH